MLTRRAQQRPGRNGCDDERDPQLDRVSGRVDVVAVLHHLLQAVLEHRVDLSNDFKEKKH